MAWATELFGPELLTHDAGMNEVVKRKTEDVLAGKKFVAIYFSAHWCPVSAP
jgi:hypothetical protein